MGELVALAPRWNSPVAQRQLERRRVEQKLLLIVSLAKAKRPDVVAEMEGYLEHFRSHVYDSFLHDEPVRLHWMNVLAIRL